MEQEEINSLIEKYIKGVATETERASLLKWYRSCADEDLPWIIADAEEEARLKNRLFQQIIAQTSPVPAMVAKKGSRSRKQLYQIAATVFILLSFSIWLFHKNDPHQQLPSSNAISNKIEPGRATAMLTLSDGTRVNLDSSKLGEVANQTGVSITKTEKGELKYEVENAESNSSTSQASYNTISTPNGGRYQVNLPDGTKVWLNAASSLKFPTVFGAIERKVELSGEAYFEVTRNTKLPFKVFSESPSGFTQEIEVLGTHFNANTYGDEGRTIRTTLVEGSVLVRSSKDNQSLRLRPGQQSTVNAKAMQIGQADLEEVLSWKNGYFLFNNEDIRTVMSKISRWYDVEVVYAKDLKNIRISGSISQEKDLTEILELLQLTRKIHFNISGRRITVMP